MSGSKLETENEFYTHFLAQRGSLDLISWLWYRTGDEADWSYNVASSNTDSSSKSNLWRISIHTIFSTNLIIYIYYICTYTFIQFIYAYLSTPHHRFKAAVLQSKPLCHTMRQGEIISVSIPLYNTLVRKEKSVKLFHLLEY